MIRYALNMEIPVSKFPFSHEDKLLFIGSCFSENISARLREYAWQIEAMPNGIVFNPVSLSEPLNRILSGCDYKESDLIQYNGLWHGKFHHGKFSETNAQDALRKMNHTLHEFKRSLNNASHLFITFGTAYTYQYIESGEIFANCHKIPQLQFNKHLLSVNEVLNTWSPLFEGLHSGFPDLKIVLTVSPVKHLRDGVVENLRSKAILIESVHQLLAQFDYTEYFPSFELVNEDLRDYRFFENDGAHPNLIATDYVFEQFCATYLDDSGKTYLKEVGDYLQLAKHKIIREEGEDYVRFMAKLEAMRKHIYDVYRVEM